MQKLLLQGLGSLAEADADAARCLSGSALTDTAGTLERYCSEIELFNPAYGLVGVQTREELYIKHILDSLAPLGEIVRLLESSPESPKRIADAGSGAGLPGIPLAIVLPQYRFTLIERMGRRTGFLRNTLAILGLENVEIEQKDVEKAAPGRFDLVCFRAFRPLEASMLEALFRLLKPGAVLAAYKARLEKIEEELVPIADKFTESRIIKTPVPFLDEERRLLVIRP